MALSMNSSLKLTNSELMTYCNKHCESYLQLKLYFAFEIQHSEFI
jgi:hypothetical protein